MKLEDIYAAEKRIRPYLKPSPLYLSTMISNLTQKNIWLKLETQLPTGTFKARPALNSILTHLTQAKQNGVVTSSSGNFAQGAAYAAKILGINITIVMTENASPYKIARTKALGATVFLSGNSHQERLEATLRIQKETNRLLIHPYDSEETIAGDGVIGLELADQLGDQLNEDMTVLVPVSGGGLIAGIAYTLKNLNFKAKIIGLQPTANTSLIESLKAGECVTVTTGPTSADALTSSAPGKIDFPFIKDYVDDILLLEEKYITEATTFFLEQHKLVVEPSGAVSLAALFAKKIKSQNIVCIVSGGNMQVKIG